MILHDVYEVLTNDNLMIFQKKEKYIKYGLIKNL